MICGIRVWAQTAESSATAQSLTPLPSMSPIGQDRSPSPAQVSPSALVPQALVFKASSLLQEKISDAAKRTQPSFVQANSMSGQTNLNTHLGGDVDFRRGDMHLRADDVDYDQAQDFLRAQGGVRINKAGNVYEGPLLELKVDAFEGFFTQPHFRLSRNDVWECLGHAFS